MVAPSQVSIKFEVIPSIGILGRYILVFFSINANYRVSYEIFEKIKLKLDVNIYFKPQEAANQ